MKKQEAEDTTVLIVDGNILFREGLAAILDNQPSFSVVSHCGSADVAVQQVVKLKPDVVLIDMNLSDGSGLQLVRDILTAEPESKVVMLTDIESDDLLIGALRNGAKGYILKNVPITTLTASLKGLCRGEAALSRTQVTRVLNEISHSYKDRNISEPDHAQLTFRELEVLKLVGIGASNREVAERLMISENTVRGHVHRILKKLSLKNRREAAQYGRKHGLIPFS